MFDKTYTKYLQEAFQIRNNSAHDDFYIVAKADGQEQLIRAREYYDTIYEYLKNL